MAVVMERRDGFDYKLRDQIDYIMKSFSFPEVQLKILVDTSS